MSSKVFGKQEITFAEGTVKSGKIDFKVDKFGIIHAGFGKVSFDSKKLSENANELIQTIVKLKPNSLKGTSLTEVKLLTRITGS